MKKLLYSMVLLVVMSAVSFAQSYSPIYATKLEFKNGVNKLTLDHLTITSSFTLHLPAGIGSSGQVLTLTDGAGQLGWTSPVTLAGANVWTGAQIFRNNPLAIDNNNGTAQELRFYEPSGSGSDYTALKAQAQGGNITYTLPAAAPSSNGQVLSSTTAGVMSWETVSGGGGGGVDALTLKDNNNVVLGRIVAFNRNNVTIITSLGYQVVILLTQVSGFDFPINQIYWTTHPCQGTPYLNDGGSGPLPNYSKTVCFSGSATQLYSLANATADGVSFSVSFTRASIENPDCQASAGAQTGWALTPRSRADIGLPATIARPLTIQ